MTFKMQLYFRKPPNENNIFLKFYIFLTHKPQEVRK